MPQDQNTTDAGAETLSRHRIIAVRPADANGNVAFTIENGQDGSNDVMISPDMILPSGAPRPGDTWVRNLKGGGCIGFYVRESVYDLLDEILDGAEYGYPLGSIHACTFCHKPLPEGRAGIAGTEIVYEHCENPNCPRNRAHAVLRDLKISEVAK